MAEILFQRKYANDMTVGHYTLGGSGLGFFGSTAGSSVQIGSYNDRTDVSNGDGSTTGASANNWKFIDTVATPTYPSGAVTIDSGSSYTTDLRFAKSYECTVGIMFQHSSAVKTQNVQLRIYDRANINYPASGVNTKVAEIINWGAGDNNASQGSAAAAAAGHIGSGDVFWWGEPWPEEALTSSTDNYYINSSAVSFYNGMNTSSKVNGDSRLGGATGDDKTVGGTGIIVPLVNSPGSGQRGLRLASQATASLSPLPKWIQYLSSTYQGYFNGNFGNGHSDATLKTRSHGGTGYDLAHTWCVGLSASPLSIGSKEQYGLYVSLEYL